MIEVPIDPALLNSRAQNEGFHSIVMPKKLAIAREALALVCRHHVNVRVLLAVIVLTKGVGHPHRLRKHAHVGLHGRLGEAFFAPRLLVGRKAFDFVDA